MREFKNEGKKSYETLAKFFETWFDKYFISDRGWKVRKTKSGYIITAHDGQVYAIHRSELSVDNLFNFIKRKTGISQNDLKIAYAKSKNPFKK